MIKEDEQRLDESLFTIDPEKALKEIRHIVSQMTGDFDHRFLGQVYEDTKILFGGQYPGYRASNTKYHNLEHTVLVTLTTTRLLHGCSLEGYNFSSKDILLALLASLFHDVGLIQFEEDTEGSGAKYTIGHEERSVIFLKNYLLDKNFSNEDIENCSNFIRCTILSLSPSAISFSSKEIETLAKIVGSADLLAQMADRFYLEKLLLLFKEFEEARLPGFDSELTLLQKTKDFYDLVAKKRLYEELDGVCDYMRFHFKNKWNLDRDFYFESIEKNIQYLDSLVVLCDESFTCYLENLQRGGISKGILEELSLKK